VYSPSLRTDRKRAQSTKIEGAAMTSDAQDSEFDGSQTEKSNPSISLLETPSTSLASLNQLGTGHNKVLSTDIPGLLHDPASHLTQDIAIMGENLTLGESAAQKSSLLVSSTGKGANCIDPAAVNSCKGVNAQKNVWNLLFSTSFFTLLSIRYIRKLTDIYSSQIGNFSVSNRDLLVGTGAEF
jgi:hypothetical protein